jgi:predicted aspartyl protease
MSDHAKEQVRRRIVAANLLVPLLLASSALSWTDTTPVSPTSSLVSPYTNYHLKLSPFVPGLAQASGALLAVHINGGPALRLLLDSGARDLVLREKVARKSGVWARSMVDLVCIGGSSRKRVPIGIAKTLDIDQFSMANVPVAIVSSGLPDGIDGVVPAFIFSRFLIQINFRERAVDLAPYPAAKSGHGPGNAVPARLNNGILFVAATIDSKSGYLILDTGAAYNAVAGPVAEDLRLAGPFAPLVDIETSNGPIQGQLGTVASLRIGDRHTTINNPVIVNLDTMSRYHGIEIMGLLGFPALERSAISINYRDCLLTITPDQRNLRRAIGNGVAVR